MQDASDAFWRGTLSETQQEDHFFLGPHSCWGPLPILAALAQWVQQRMMMQPTSDPQQRTTQQIMQFMPLLILLFATNYPAGLALYWVTSTCFSIVMQYFITGWGQLFTNPLQVPEAAAPTSRPTPPPPLPRPTRPGPRALGQRPERARASSPARLTLARRSPTPTADEGRGPGARETGPARRSKVQRAARRPKGHARSSRSAKRQ